MLYGGWFDIYLTEIQTLKVARGEKDEVQKLDVKSLIT